MQFSDEHRETKDAARDLLTRRVTQTRLGELARTGTADEGLWTEMVDLFWPAVPVPEEYGGLGLGVIGAVCLAEESGYALASTPLPSTLACTVAIEHAGSESQREMWLPLLASGEAVGAIASPTALGDDALVADAASAEVVVVLDVDGTASLIRHSGRVTHKIATIDPTRSYAVACGVGEPLSAEIPASPSRAAVIWAAELVGISQRMLDDTVEYVGQRSQFGRPIGEFQAVSHRCADMLIDLEAARSVVYGAALADAIDEAAALTSMACLLAGDAAKRITASAIQAHGGIGFTWEAGLHLWLRRAQVTAQMWAEPRRHRKHIAAWARACAAVGNSR